MENLVAERDQEKKSLEENLKQLKEALRTTQDQQETQSKGGILNFSAPPSGN